jgi:biopolymer transport protein ExbD
MAGVDVGGGGGGKKKLDSEINMIPMIDLLMVTISFLLITAVWTHMARINADAQVPGPPDPMKPVEDTKEDKTLHILMNDPAQFTVQWKQGAVVVNSFTVPRHDDVQGSGKAKIVRYPDLAAKIAGEWQTTGAHREATDAKFDQAVLHTDNETPYLYVIGVIDALYQPHRALTLSGKTEQVPAFNVTFSVN